jgi:hypothetical protein
LETIEIRRRWPEVRQEIHERFRAYQRLPEQIRQTVRESLPSVARVLVVSKGDSRLTDLGPCQAWHFPQDKDGVYSGFYPATSQDAIDQVETLRSKGAEFLLFPNSAFWWLKEYDDFARHLETQYEKVADNEHCLIYELAPGSASLGKLDRQLQRLAGCEEMLRHLVLNNANRAPLPQSNGALRDRELVVPKQDSYRQLISRIRNIVQSVVPKGARILVVSKGDPELVELPKHVATHFPQARSGGYAGHHPADSAAAITQLESLRSDEDSYLLIPATAYWWLGHYREFRRHLENHYQRFWNDDSCMIYELSLRPGSQQSDQNGHAPKSGFISRWRSRLIPAPVGSNGRSHS